MYIHQSYDREFVDYMMYLRSKYPKELFNLEGIGDQLDVAKFSKEFFLNSKSVSDVSVDSNSNVDENSVVAYEVELPKSIFRLNSFYLIWKYMKRLYNLETANEFLESQITGCIYLNDAHGVNKSYSYYADTLIHVKINGEHKMLKLKKLYDLFEFNEYDEGDAIQITDFNEDLRYGIVKRNEIEILDENNKWVKLKRILKHKRHNKLLIIETKNGHRTIVTEDHPVILDNKQIKLAKDLTPNDSILLADNIIHEFENKYILSQEFGYIIGFILGDGNIGNTHTQITQNDFENSKIVECLNKNNFRYTIKNNSKFGKEGCGHLTICNKEFVDFCTNILQMDKMSYAKNIPTNIFQYNKEFTIGIIEGLIDSNGTINSKCGVINIRVNSFSMVQGIKEILKSIGIKATIRGCSVPKHVNSNSYRQQYEIFSVNFRLTSENINTFNISEKIKSNINLITKQPAKDGRYETNKIHIIREFTGKHPMLYDEFVYDITTETGTFYSQGMIQHNCYNFSTLDIMYQGLPFITKIKSETPKHFSSFIGQLIHFTVYASNSILGAVGLSDIFIVSSYYINKLLTENPEIPDEYKWKQIKQEIQSFIYSCNQPFRGGLQSGFYNISVYDDIFLDKLCNEYVFIDGSKPDKVLVKRIQELYLDLMNETLRRTPITFPVTTACFAVNDDKILQDENFLSMIALKNTEFGFINIYSGKTSTLSSCCLSKNTKVLVKSTNGVLYDTIENIHNLNYENFTIYHNGSWVKGKSIKVQGNTKQLFKITTMNNKEIIVTNDHINPTLNGDKLTTDLSTLDYILFNNRQLDSYPEINEHLTYEQGFLIGLYAGDGSKYRRTDCEGYEVTFSLNETDINCLPYLTKALKDWNINKQYHINNSTNNVMFVKIYSKDLFNIINKYIIGNYSYEKEFNMDILLQSKQFRKGIIDGWYQSDGGNSNRIYSISQKLIETGEILLNSLGINSVINISDRTKELIVIRNTEYSRNYPLYCIRWYNMKNKRSMGDIYKVVNNSEYFKIKNIKQVDNEDYVYCFEIKNKDEPYFTLPNGIITHNCRLRSDTDNLYFNQFGSGGTKIGSQNVVTLNLPRYAFIANGDVDKFIELVKKYTNLSIKISNTKRHLLQRRIDEDRAPLYTLDFMSLNTQYSTTGVLGITEACEILGFDILTENGQDLVCKILDSINHLNDVASKQYKAPHNMEAVPGENSSVKIASKDRLLGYNKKYELYSNQFINLTTNADMLDRIKLQGLFDSKMSGGAILHINVETSITDSKLIEDLIRTTISMGVIYHAINYNLQQCENGHMSVGNRDSCLICNGKIIAQYSRVVGFLTNIKNWNKVRREYDYPNRVWYKNI